MPFLPKRRSKGRAPRRPGSSRRLRLPRIIRRPDGLLVLLVLIIAALIMAHLGGDSSALRQLQGEEPIAAEEAHEALLPSVDDSSIPEAGEPLRFLMLNAGNYFLAGEKQRSRYKLTPKPESAREAVADVIASAKPEIVGLTEIGGPLALADLRQRLSRRGLDYPYYRVLLRQGDDRALALLSLHPIVQDNSRANVKLYGEQRRKMLRGILDVTVRLEDGRMFRILGAHLKSRVARDAGAAASLRAREAHTLAMRVQQIVRQQPRMPLLVYGDWNDDPTDASLGVLREGLSKDAALTLLRPLDSAGGGWTLHYKAGNDYCIFDQLYVNKVLRQRRGRRSEEGIVDIPAARNASDHRAVWCELR